MRIGSAKDLAVYQRAYELAVRIFEVSQRFPLEERYARVDTRPILTDSDGENAETDSLIQFATDCGYLIGGEQKEFSPLNSEVGRMSGSIKDPSKFLQKS